MSETPEEILEEIKRLKALKAEQEDRLKVLLACEGKPDEVAIAAGVMITEDELDRRIESGEITCPKDVDKVIIKLNNGTYGVIDNDD